MTLIQSISPPLNLKSPFLLFRVPKKPPRIRYCRQSQLRIRSSLDDLIGTLIASNPIDFIPAAVTLASGAALYLSRGRVSGSSPEPVVADWILFTSPTPFNRCILLRCPSISFEDREESDEFLREERHYVNLSRGRILGRNKEELEEEEEVRYQRVCVRTEDGGVISLDWPENLDLGKEHGLDTTVLIVPGTVEGSMDRDVRRFVFDALRSGCFPVVMNPRGCAGSPLMTARLFTAADSDDICTAVKYVNRLRTWTTLMGVGFGYGANMLTKYLAEAGESTPLTAAVCIDNPFDLEEATGSVPYHTALDQKLTGGLIEILRANKELFQGKAKGFDLAKAFSATSARDFDKAVSMISYGFDTVEDFYSMTSTRELVNKLKIPVLFIQSDDGSVPPFSVPRSAIAENPFTSLLLCSCHASVIGRIKRSAILWCQQLTIEWLSAVELALLKGRHALLKDVDITINPSKGLSFINVDTSEESISVQSRTRETYDSAQWFLSHKNANNDASMKLAPSNRVNGFRVDQFANEKDGVAQYKLNTNPKSESESGRQKSDIGLKEDRNADAPQDSSTNEGDSPTDIEESKVLQAAAVVMNMLDVTMPGTLDDGQKKKVLTAMEQGETLMKALEGAVPDEVRGKLTTAVTEIMQTQGTKLNFDALRRINWIHKPGKSRNQEKSKETSTTESGQDDAHPSDLRKNDGRTQESTESAPESTEASQEKSAQASAHDESGTEVASKASHSEKLEEASGATDENNGDQYKVNQSSGKGDKHSAQEQIPSDENDIQNRETRKVDSPAEQNIATPATNSEEALSAGSSDSEPKGEEKEKDVQKNEKNEVQKNENKSTQDAVDQSVQSSTKPEENMPQQSSLEPPPISVTQALDAFTGFDDSTQMAVNSVYGVIEGMIDQFEKASNKENGDEINNKENNELVNKSEKTDNSKNKSHVEPDVVKPSNHPENTLQEEDAKSYEEVQDNLKKVSYSLTSSVNNSIGQVKESNAGFKDLENRNLNKVGHVSNFPLDVAGNQYWESPYAAYLHRYLSTQLPTMKSVDLESTTDLFLDPEEGRWRMIDQSGYTKNASKGSVQNQNINGSDHSVHKNDMEDIIEPSYVILDNEFSRFEQESNEEQDAAEDKHDGDKEELTCLIKNTLLDALKIEVSRKLGNPNLKDLESSLVYDLEQFADTVSRAVVHDNELNLDSFSESGNTYSMKFGTIEADNIIKTISSAVLVASHLGKVLPLGVIVGSSLASLRTYFQVVSLHDDDQGEAVQKSRHMQENSYSQERETKKGISSNGEDQYVASDNNPISKGHEKLETDDSNNGGIMVGAVTAALGASALLAHHGQNKIHIHDKSIGSVSFNERGSQEGNVKLEDARQEKDENNLVSSLAEKALSVAGPVVPTKSGGEVDQERLVAILSELGQKGGILRFIGKFALLWGGIRGAMSLTDRLISFLHIAKRPLPHRVLGFVCMVLVLWSPIVIPLLPSIVQSWMTRTSNGIVDYACIVGLYVAVTILTMLWGKRIRGYENPLQQYGLELTSASRVHEFFKGFVGGITVVLCIHLINALLGYARLSWPGPPSSSEGALAFIAYGNMLLLALRGFMTATGIAVVEELLFRSWLAEEVATDLGYYQAILISGLAFSLSQRSLPSVPGFLLLSLALFGMKQRTEGNLSAPIGMRAGIMTTNFILQTGGFLTYWPSTPPWLANTHPWHPFEGVVGLGSCAILAILFYPKPPQRKEMSGDVQEMSEDVQE